MDTVINYEFKCIYCQSKNVYAATNDGGSVQGCKSCGKTYKAKILAAELTFEQAFPNGRPNKPYSSNHQNMKT